MGEETDAERTYRWLTQAEVDRLEQAAFARGAEAMRRKAARIADGYFYTQAHGARLALQILHLSIPEDE